MIEVRGEVDGVEVDLASAARLCYRMRRHENGWLIHSLDPVYERDTLTPSHPGETLPIGPSDVARFRPSYRFLSYVLSRRDYPVGDDLYGDDRPKRPHSSTRPHTNGCGPADTPASRHKEPPMSHRPYRIADVTVVDPRDGTHTAHQDIHIADGRITAVTAAADHGDPDTVDGRARYVVPGYLDMHAHPLTLPDPRDTLALMLAFGITGYRQMGGNPDLLERRRTGRLDFGDRAPRLLAMPGSLLTPLNAGTPEAAVAEAGRQARAGADFLKAALITPEVYFAVQGEATRLGIPVCGHLPAGIDVRAAATAGFRSIEHLGPGLGVLAGCSCHEEQILAETPDRSPIKLPPIHLPFLEKMLLNKRILLNPAQRTSPAGLANLRHALDTFDEEKARALAQHFAARGTWHCPTLIRVKAQELCDAPAFAADPDLRYIAPKERKSWQRAADAFAAKFDATQREIFAAQFAMQLRLVKIFATEGVPLLAGTDAVGAAWVVPGASLYDEFDLLADAGLDPLRILRSTTSDAARFLDRENVAGTVEAGKEADLVLLDADPTAEVANLHTVSGVVCRGIHYSDTDLAAIKDRSRRTR